MAKLKHAIITCADGNHGYFVAKHWFRSLKATNSLRNIDVIIIDYGIRKEHAAALKAEGALLFGCVKDGFPNSIKFRDMVRILSKRKYDQILTCDGGDLIFQDSLHELFSNDKGMFRAVCEPYAAPFDKLYLHAIDKKAIPKIKKVMKGKKLVNVGMVVGPYAKFVRMCKESDLLIKERTFGPDSVAVNYILYRDGFKEIDAKYNFVITTSRKPFYIEKGIFYLKGNGKIPIVHNAGGKKFFRPVNNFGYGKGYNQIKPTFFLIKALVRTTYYIANWLK